MVDPQTPGDATRHGRARADGRPAYWPGFTTQSRELAACQIPLQGRLPEWLRGTLIRTGPGQFEVGADRYRHWFDGLAQLHRFGLRDGAVTYANLFVRGDSYRDARQSGRISRREFATDPCLSLFGRLRTLFDPRVTDNANVNVARLAGEYVALTEVPLPIAFDPETLATLGKRRYEAPLDGQITTAHPHFDFGRGCAFNYQARLGRTSRYLIYSTGASSARGQLLATIGVDKPAYVHSFGMSERYLVLVEFPLVVSPLRLALSGLTATPFIDNYRWRPERGTRFWVIDKADGRVVRRAESDACFVFHHVNAFERGDELIVDMVVYDDDAIVRSFYLDALARCCELAAGRLTRFRLGLASGGVSVEPLAEARLELPRFHYRAHAGRPYRFLFGAGNRLWGNFLDELIKVDLHDGTARRWFEQDCYPGEPVFVPAPAGGEDAGVALSVVLDARQNRSFLLVLDGETFEERARAVVPQVIPFGFHGQFFSA